MESSRKFYSYASALIELGISRRTLQRWMDDLGITPIEFENCRKAFLTYIQIEELARYRQVMATRDFVLIDRYRSAITTADTDAAHRIVCSVTGDSSHVCREK